MTVYLRTDPEVVHNRILQRARKEEKTVPLSYIEALHKIHEDWYIFSIDLFIIMSYIISFVHYFRLHDKKSFPVPAPVIEINANVNLAEMLQQIASVETHILNRKKPRVFTPSLSPSKLVSPA